MKNYTNIYDVDGELIRSAYDNTKWSLDEAKKRVNMYTEKLKDIDENDPKYTQYITYIRNLNAYIFDLYSKMSPEELQQEYNMLKTDTNIDEQIRKAMEDLQNEVENDETAGSSTENEVQGESTEDNQSDTNTESGDDETIERTNSDIHEEGPTTQGDLLVERADVTNSMDEYVDFEEVNEDNIQ